ncbi:MAG: metal-dependent hydrolase [candidate division Zixibacteria bacterium]|nr:metal-dependent hydrolase [candidate division Zixibacteria bacterium]
MFLGHMAVGLGAKKYAPRVSLGTLLLATQFIDLLWPIFLLLGLEHVRVEPGNTVVTPLNLYDYPYTHSLAGALVWAVLFALIYFWFRQSRRGAIVLGGVVFSHWVLDLVTHRPDLPLAPGVNAYFGWGLWNSFYGSLIVELALFVLGIMFFLRTSRAKDKVGVFAFWALMILLVAIAFGGYYGPPPSDPKAIGYVGLAAWLFVIWGYWIDRHRVAR